MNIFSKHQVIVSLGSNCDQREDKLRQALDALCKEYGELHVSPVYDSGADDNEKCNDTRAEFEQSSHYLNVVVSFFSDKSVADIQRMHKQIEHAGGRNREESTVAIDIDFLFYGNVQGELDGVCFPRKDALRYAYVLRPLADLFPHYTHASLDKTFVDLWYESGATTVLQPVEFVWSGQVVSVSPPFFPL